MLCWSTRIDGWQKKKKETLFKGGGRVHKSERGVAFQATVVVSSSGCTSTDASNAASTKLLFLGTCSQRWYGYLTNESLALLHAVDYVLLEVYHGSHCKQRRWGAPLKKGTTGTAGELFVLPTFCATSSVILQALTYSVLSAISRTDPGMLKHR